MELRLASAEWARLQLSPDGQRLLATWRDGATQRSLFNGRELPVVDGRRGGKLACQWSTDLSQRAATERRAEALSVVLSNVDRDSRIGPFDDITLGRSCFSTPGVRLLFAFKRDGGWWVWLDGTELGPYTAIGDISWHGAIPSFVAREGAKTQVWIDGRSFGPFPSVSTVAIAADGTPAICIKKGTSHFIVHGDKRHGPFQERPRFALGDGGRLAFARTLDGEVQVELGDGQVVERLTRIRTLRNCFSPRGVRMGFAYDHGNLSGFFLDGHRRENLGYTDGPWWSPDGAHVAWGADDKSGALFVDGAEHPLPLRIDWESGSSFRFAPTGDFCFTLDADGEQLLRIGPTEFGPFQLAYSARDAEHEKIAFSADGSHFAFQYRDDTGTFVRHNARTLGPYPDETTFTLTPAGALYVATLDPESLLATVISPPDG